MRLLCLAFLATFIASGQTKPNLGQQGTNADFSSFSYTKPVSVVTSLPATCSLYSMVWLTTATAGQNLYGCTATNVWTNFGTSGGGSGTVNSGTANQLAYYAANGSTLSGLTLGTNLSITSGTLNATGGGGGSGTVQSGTTGQFAYYPSSGTIVEGVTAQSIPVCASGVNGVCINSFTGNLEIHTTPTTITSTTYSFSATDVNGTLLWNCTGSCTGSFPTPTGSAFPAGANTMVKNIGSGTITLNVSGGTIGGSSTQSLAATKWFVVISDGSNFQIGMQN